MKTILVFFCFLFCLISSAQDTLVTSKKSVISLDKIKVVYRGFSNPISIAVNNAKSYFIYGNDVSKNEEGEYILSPGSGNETKVFVEIENYDGSKVVEEHVFRIINIPMHQTTINGNYSTFRSSLEFKIEELIDAEIGVKFIDFFFITCKVSHFNLKIPRHPSITIEGNTFTDEVIELLKKVRKNDFIIISNIKCNYIGITASCIKNPSPIVFKIVKD